MDASGDAANAAAPKDCTLMAIAAIAIVLKLKLDLTHPIESTGSHVFSHQIYIYIILSVIYRFL